MKKQALFFPLLLATTIGFAQTKEINFDHSSFAEIKAKAKKENKLVFIDAYTSWCGPCKWMAANVFTNDTVADYFNKTFINAKIDMEKGEGPEIAKKYDVRCYPNFLFLDGDGKLVHRGAGGLPVKQFIELAQNASDPKKNYSHLAEEFASKKNNPEFLLEYINVTSTTCLPIDELLADYFKTQKEEDLSNRANWGAIRDFSEDYKSREFAYLLKHVDVYRKLYTVDSVDSKIKGVLINGGYGAMYKKGATEKDYAAYVDEIKALNFSGTDEVLFTLDMASAEQIGDWAKYAKVFVEKGDKFLKSVDQKNSAAWNLYENSDDKKALEKAAQIMSVVVKDTPDYACCDTYAAVLYKLKKKTEAKAAANKAIELAKKEGFDAERYKETTELLKKIEKL